MADDARQRNPQRRGQHCRTDVIRKDLEFVCRRKRQLPAYIPGGKADKRKEKKERFGNSKGLSPIQGPARNMKQGCLHAA